MGTEMNIEAERATFITAYRLWAYEAHPNAHPEMVQFQAESHWGRAAGAMWLAARRAIQPADVGAGELPPLPAPDVIAYSCVGDNDAYSPMLVERIVAAAIAADRAQQAKVVAPSDDGRYVKLVSQVHYWMDRGDHATNALEQAEYEIADLRAQLARQSQSQKENQQ